MHFKESICLNFYVKYLFFETCFEKLFNYSFCMQNITKGQMIGFAVKKNYMCKTVSTTTALFFENINIRNKKTSKFCNIKKETFCNESILYQAIDLEHPLAPHTVCFSFTSQYWQKILVFFAINYFPAYK